MMNFILKLNAFRAMIVQFSSSLATWVQKMLCRPWPEGHHSSPELENDTRPLVFTSTRVLIVANESLTS